MYTYGSIFSEILLLAKDKNDLNAQSLFFEMFFVSTRLYLIDIINNNSYSHIILSPLRRERLLDSAWHTNIFYEKVLLSLSDDFRIKENYPHIMSAQIITKSQKQASIPSKKRKIIDQHKEEESIIFKYINYNKNNSFKNNNILLLDDVITSGNTLISFKKNINKIIENNNCDILTLFRSPQSAKINFD